MHLAIIHVVNLIANIMGDKCQDGVHFRLNFTFASLFGRLINGMALSRFLSVYTGAVSNRFALDDTINK